MRPDKLHRCLAVSLTALAVIAVIFLAFVVILPDAANSFVGLGMAALFFIALYTFFYFSAWYEEVSKTEGSDCR